MTDSELAQRETEKTRKNKTLLVQSAKSAGISPTADESGRQKRKFIHMIKSDKYLKSNQSIQQIWEKNSQ